MSRSQKQTPRRQDFALPVKVFELEVFESRQMLSASTKVALPNLEITAARSTATTIQGYTPAQIKTAYGFTSLKGDGTGQTIAIVDAFNDPNIASDLAVFSKQFGLSSASLQVVNQTGGSVKSVATDSGWAGEIALDVEWAHAIAPGAKILLVETNSDNESDLMAGVNYARNAAGVSVVSMSWGESEYVGQTAYDSYFTTPAGHIGVTFLASSGDEGVAWGPEYPASSPNVISVGGTTLSLKSSGAISSETGWRNSTGGTSTIEKAPSYQSGASSSSKRTAPDVSYNADPNTGFAVYDSLPDGGVSGWQVVGGTSAGAPQWGALIAIANQTRVAAGLGTLDGASQTLPTLYSLYASPSSVSYSNYTSSFNDITTGGGSFRGGGFGGWGFRGRSNVGVGGASAGYDSITGLGSPKAGAVVQALVKTTAVAAKTVAKATVTKGKSSSSFARSSQTADQATSATTVSLSQELAALDSTIRSPSAATSAGEPINLSGVRSGVLRVNEASAPRIAEPFLRSVHASIAGDVIQVAGNAAVSAMQSAMVSATMTTMISGTLSLTQSTTGNLHFPHFDPSVLFDDVIGSFVNESASLATSVRGDASTWAWAVTIAVLGTDAALVGRWVSKARNPNPRYATRSARKEMLSLQPMDA